MTPDRVRAAIDDLNQWFDRTGLAGWDPYDIRGDRRFFDLTSIKEGASKRSATGTVAEAAARLWPRAVRRAYGIEPSVNSKGVALYLASQVRLVRIGVPNSSERARGAADWLVSNAASDYPGTGWGYPFVWYSNVDIPAGTPSSVATSTVGQALLDYAEETGDDAALEAARDGATFLAEALRIDAFDDGSVCFSYTPLDDFHVYNASLMTAEYLLRASRVFDEPAWEELAGRALRYVVREQCDDGSFEYWGEDQRGGSRIDHYHTGFILRSLWAFEEAGYEEAAEALGRGWENYRATLFDGDVPLNNPGVSNVLNIHSCAEAVLCPATLANRFDEALGLSRSVAEWTLDSMRNPDGTFVYARRGNWKERMVYWRWSQAWMMRALCELVLAEDRFHSTDG